jgi:pentatricopeptide repeat protein
MARSWKLVLQALGNIRTSSLQAHIDSHVFPAASVKLRAALSFQETSLLSIRRLSIPRTELVSNGSPTKEENEMISLLMKKECKSVIKLLRVLQDRRQATVFAYNVALSACAILRDADNALKTFEDLQIDTKGGADHYSFGCLSSALCRAGRVDEAVSLLNKMVECKVKPNIVIMNTLLHGAVTAGRIDLANWIRVVIREEGLKINEMTLIGVVRLAALRCNADEVTSAWLETVNLLAQSNARCSRAAIAALVVAYSQCDEPDLAINAIQILSETLVDPADTVTTSTLLAAAGRYVTGIARHDDRIHENVGVDEGIERKMANVGEGKKTRNLNLNHHIHAAFASAANAYSRAGKDASVKKVISLLDFVGGMPYAPAIIAQIKGLVEREVSNRGTKDIDVHHDALYKSVGFKATRIHDLVDKKFKQSGFTPTNEVYNALLREKSRHGGLAAALAQWKLMKKEVVPFVPDIYSYGTLLAAHSAELDVDGAWDTWTTMSEARIAPDEACVVSLISAHARRNKSSSADTRVLRVVSELKILGRSHTVATGTAMSRVLGQLGMAKEAFEVMQELQDSGHSLETRSFNTMLHVVADCRMDISESVAVFRDMIHHGCKPDRRSFNALISNTLSYPASSFAFDHLQHESLAGRLSTFFLAFMTSSGIRPETDTFNVSLRSAIFSNRLSIARDLMIEMRQSGISCNERTIFTILSAGRLCNNRHSQQEMNWVLEESIKLGARPREKVLNDLVNSALWKGDIAQAVWYLGLCVTYRLAHPNLSLDLIRKLDTKVQFVVEMISVSTITYDLYRRSSKKRIALNLFGGKVWNLAVRHLSEKWTHNTCARLFTDLSCCCFKIRSKFESSKKPFENRNVLFCMHNTNKYGLEYK